MVLFTLSSALHAERSTPFEVQPQKERLCLFLLYFKLYIKVSI